MPRKERIIRRSYNKLPGAAPMPHFLKLQFESFNSFLQADVPPEKRERKGLEGVFRDVFPIQDIHHAYSLEFVRYDVGNPKYTVDECKERNVTYGAPLKAVLRLLVKDPTLKERPVKEVIEQEVYLGELPLMTDRGTFIINGAERVVVSQLHRSPGPCFESIIHPNGKRMFSARIIPYQGSWMEFLLDINDTIYVYIDHRRRMPVTTFLRAIGYSSNEEIFKLFHSTKRLPISKKDLLVGGISAQDLVDRSTGEVLIEAGQRIKEEDWERLKEAGISEVEILSLKERREADPLRNTLKKDQTRSQEEALHAIYTSMRGGEAPNLDTARSFLERLCFNPQRFNLGLVGRYRMNKRLGLDLPADHIALHPDDVVGMVKALIEFKLGKGYFDDIDHLGNRRLKGVGEQLVNTFSIGLTRMARAIRERMSLRETDSITPRDLVNAKTVSSVVETFFGTSQLSQFLDQTNPLAELTNKRRLSALGPGGLSRKRAGFEVRDVHRTHYGRICPIETPEGPNIGLITSLATYAQVNEYGFLVTPYWKVEKGKVTNKVEYLSAEEEDRFTIAQANAELSPQREFVSSKIKARKKGEFSLVTPEEIDYMDVSPAQLVSVSAALIPFLEHDDANRALMGSNMQRQAVPLLFPQAPLVGTGIEEKVARDTGMAIVAQESGWVESVSADRIVIRPEGDLQGEASLFGVREYRLRKFYRSNQDTCINQRPLVKEGEWVEKGEVIADGMATDRGELALGANVLVAFLPWKGYNYEDAVVVSERLLEKDIFTSVHIQEFELQVRDTKRGPEELTREIPNVSEEAVRNLDAQGVIVVGAEVEAGDILVGKVTPKGETELSPEERLLRAIFGEKAWDVRDASLKAPPGMKGTVIATKIFSRKEHTPEAKAREREQTEEVRARFEQLISDIKRRRDERLLTVLSGGVAGSDLPGRDGQVVIKKGTRYKNRDLAKVNFDLIPRGLSLTTSKERNEKAQEILRTADWLIESNRRRLESELEKVTRGDELPPGVLKLVKVWVATKRRLSVGDKMAGRHGNKGVVAKIVPVEDMPYLPDGTPVDIVLNPLGVPSRMNVGQVMETHLGWAAKKLGYWVESPVFSGATIGEVKGALQEAGLPSDGKTILYDGLTGEPFSSKITVGCMYMMKLWHLVDDKIHARSIGPYSLVTQQPLGGKAQFGGQRFGEMEVWALEAYGAAYSLQEMLTVKSDDVSGRSRIYEAIVKGENPAEPGIPESFNVLVKELQSLCLDVKLEERD